MGLSKTQAAFLAFAEDRCHECFEMAGAARQLDTTVSGLSNTRNNCLRLGYIRQWQRWNDLPMLTPDGHAALRSWQSRQ